MAKWSMAFGVGLAIMCGLARLGVFCAIATAAPLAVGYLVAHPKIHVIRRSPVACVLLLYVASVVISAVLIVASELVTHL
jgi:hypothetical protein